MKTIVSLAGDPGARKGVEFLLTGGEGQQLRDILLKHLPAWAELFARKNAEYGENAQTLGPRGQFSDMYRKMIKLKTAMWDDNEHLLTSEGVDEILMDLIGHCFLTLQMRGSSASEDAEESGVTNLSRYSPEFELDMGGGIIIRKGDTVQFKQHLGIGSKYVAQGLDMSRPRGMVILIQDDKFENPAEWTNPDWLEVLI